MVLNFFDELFSFIITALFALGAVGFFVAWGGTIFAYYTNKIPSFIAIALTSVFAFTCAFLSAWQIASTKATNEAEFQCRILQEKARADGKEAAIAAQKRIMEMQKIRADIAERARLEADNKAKNLATELEQAEAERLAVESKINELEQSLPENPSCITPDDLHDRLSD